MRQGLTWVLLAAVGVLVALALADALRPSPEEEREAPATDTGTPPPTLRETLRAEGVAGLVLYSDQDCILHSLLLPRMGDDVVRDEGGADVFHCRFGVAGGRIIEEDEIPSPDETLLARCRKGHVEVLDLASRKSLSRDRGCPAAWRPDGGLTYVRNGRVLLGGGLVLLSRRELRVAARAHPNLSTYEASFDVDVTDLAWFDETNVVVAMEISGRFLEPQFLAVVFRDKAITAVAVDFRGPYENLVVSPGASFAASEDGALFTRDGRALDPPQNLPTGRAVAFSPDERWFAYVTGASIYLVGTPANDEPGRLIRLPIQAQDLAWDPVTAGTSGDPPAAR
ncbi:MAG: hypothetical protein ABI649_01120 [Gaiellaceae bacterium]